MSDIIPEKVLAYINRCPVTYDTDGVPTFYDESGVPHYDLSRPGVPPLSVREVVAWTRTARPDLWGKPATTETVAKSAAPVAPPSTAADAMAAVRAGSMSAEAATAVLFKRSAPVPASPAPVPATPPALTQDSMTDLMVRVRAGDAKAHADISRLYLNPTR